MRYQLFLLIASILLTSCGGGSSDIGGGQSGNETNIDMAITSFDTTTSSVNSGEIIKVHISIENHGSTINSPSSTIFLSLDNTLDFISDTLMNVSVPALYIAPGSSIQDELEITIPTNLRSGLYYLIADAPYGPEAPDVTPNNNRALIALAVAGKDCSPDKNEDDDNPNSAIEISLGQGFTQNHCDDPDDWFVFSAAAGQVYNFETVAIGAASNTRLQLFNSDGATLIQENALNGGSGADARLLWRANSSGIFYIRASSFFNLNDTGPNTDYSISMSNKVPDILMTTTSVSLSAQPGASISMQSSASNIGDTYTGPFGAFYYLSDDSDISSGDRLIGFWIVSDLGPGGTIEDSSLLLTLPDNIAPGNYHIGVVGDVEKQVLEQDETNNRWAVPITIN